MIVYLLLLLCIAGPQYCASPVPSLKLGNNIVQIQYLIVCFLYSYEYLIKSLKRFEIA